MKQSLSGKKKKQKCDWCKQPLGDVFFTDSKTKKSFHVLLGGIDCLKHFINSQTYKQDAN